MAEEMSESNQDGLGYTAIDEQGNMFGERWWYNNEAFTVREAKSKGKVIDHSVVDKYKESLKDFLTLHNESAVPEHEKYNNFGELTSEITAITLHTRFATSAKSFCNTHPFVDDNASVSVVHNGVIRNHEKADEIRSTCDSERILNKYLEHKIDKNPGDVQSMVKDLTGGFACGVFAKDGEGRRVLDVFRTTSQLTCAYIQELECLVFSTSMDDIKRVVRKMDLTIVSKCEFIKENVLQRFNAITGEPMVAVPYKEYWAVTTSSSSTSTSTYNYNNYDNVRQWHNRRTAKAIESKRSESQEVKDLKKNGLTNEEIERSLSSSEEDWSYINGLWFKN